MSTNYPTSLDTYTAHADGVSEVIAAAHINALQDAVAALEAKVGADSSAVTTTLDYKVAHAAQVFAWEPPAGARTSRSFAWKGSIFTPSVNMTLLGVRKVATANGDASIDDTVGRTWNGAVITVSAGAIATITKGVTSYTSSSSIVRINNDFIFASPVALIAGVAYGLLIGYDSSGGGATTTTDLPVGIARRTAWQSLYPALGSFSTSVYHIASLNPVVTTAVTTATNDQESGASTYAVAPIFHI